MEPGLALMDEIGRKALTSAFIEFSRENSRSLNPYKPLYAYCPELTPEEGENITTFNDSEILEKENEYNANCNLPKCPSDPYIQKGFHSSPSTTRGTKYDNLPSMLITPASVSNSTSWQAGSAVQAPTSHHQPEKSDHSVPAIVGLIPSENNEYGSTILCFIY